MNRIPFKTAEYGIDYLYSKIYIYCNSLKYTIFVKKLPYIYYSLNGFDNTLDTL